MTLAADVREILDSGVPEEHRGRSSHAIAVAGTATSLASIAQELDPYDPEKVEGYVLARPKPSNFSPGSRPCRSSSAGKRPGAAPRSRADDRRRRGDPDRGHAAVRARQVEVSEHDILRGAALGLSE